MSIPFSGTRTRSGGVMSAIVKELRKVKLEPVSQISVQFDPFHEKSRTVRDFLFFMSGKKVLQTNPDCKCITKIVCDRSEPIITFGLDSGDKVVFKVENLTPLNILQQYNKHISSLVKVEPGKEVDRKKKIVRQTLKVKPGSKRRGTILLTGAT